MEKLRSNPRSRTVADSNDSCGLEMEVKAAEVPYTLMDLNSKKASLNALGLYLTNASQIPGHPADV
jgi:hypothetical protein